MTRLQVKMEITATDANGGPLSPGEQDAWNLVATEMALAVQSRLRDPLAQESALFQSINRATARQEWHARQR
jgi:hypothetical protein